MTPSQRIEIRDLQPMMVGWIMRAALIFAVMLLMASAGILVATALALASKPVVWATTPSGQIFAITPIPAKEADRIIARGVASQELRGLGR